MMTVPLMEPAPPPAPASPRFSLPLAAWIAWSLYAVVRVFLFLRAPASASPAEIGELCADLVVSLLMPAILAALFWRVGRRSGTASLITFFAVFGVLLVGRLHQRPPAAAANDRAVSEAAKALTESVSAATKRYSQAMNQLGLGNFFDLQQLDRPEQIDARRKLVEAFQAASDDLRQLQSHGAERIDEEMTQRHVGEAVASRALAGYRNAVASSQPLIKKLHETDAHFAETLHAFLDLAQFNLGAWRYDATLRGIHFDNDGAAVRYNYLLGEAKTLAEEQAVLQRQLIGER